MVIDLGKPKVLKGLLAKRGKDARVSRRRVGAPFAGPIKKREQVRFVID